MTMSDSIADMLTRIRNGQKSKLLSISLPISRLKCNILEVLKGEGFIADYVKNEDNSLINISLKYSRFGEPVITQIHRISKPGKRIYSSVKQLPRYFNDMGIYIVSTSQGMMSDRQARKKNIGGEVICKIF